MKIWGNVPSVTGVYGKNGKIGKTSKIQETSTKRDELSISGAAKDYSVVMKALQQVPDVRQDKINEITQRIESGNYSVSSTDIVDRMVSSLTKKDI
ncbi:MAG: flagellar biosynthesis anti-sigma factor FlgM [Acetivibrionales bacterium]|jgi:negative regulator of flagellin synthesis FlgM|nr:flagellar biosynthesis anti-sigma factor FlgM [Clostridiaceae bacterium]